MQAALDELVTLLALEPIEVNIFRGRSPTRTASACSAARSPARRSSPRPARSTTQRASSTPCTPTSCGPATPRCRSSTRSTASATGAASRTRRVVAIQHGRAIFNLQASFHAPEEGPDHQITMPPGLPDPESLPDWHTRMAPYKDQMGEWYDRPRPIDVRYIDGDPMSRKGVPSDGQRVWLRADGQLPDDPVVHACIVTYASDMSLLDTTVLPFGLAWDSPGMQMASLDHAMWFHRDFRADEWMLYDQHALSTGSHAAWPAGRIFASDGRLVVSVVQEGLAAWVGRVRRRPPDRRRSLLVTAAVVVRRRRRCDHRRRTPSRQLRPRPRRRRRPLRRRRRPRRSRRAPPAPSSTEQRHDRATGGSDPAGAVPMTGNEPSVTFTEIGSFDAPVDLAWRAGDDAVYVVEQGGTIQRVLDDETTTVLDISDLTDANGERGLLGLTFSPAGDLAYVNYTDLNGDTTISEHPVADDGTFGAGDNARTLLVIDQPYENHNGGDLLVRARRDALHRHGRRRLRGRPGAAGDRPGRAARQAAAHRSGAVGRPRLHGAAGQPVRRRRRRRARGVVERPAQPVALLVRPRHRRPVDRRRRPERDRGDRRRPGDRRSRRGQGRELRLERARGRRARSTRTWRSRIPSHRSGPTPTTRAAAPSAAACARGAVPFPTSSAGTSTATSAPGRSGRWRCSATGNDLTPGRQVDLGELPAVTAVVDGPGGEVYALSQQGAVVRLDAPRTP